MPQIENQELEYIEKSLEKKKWQALKNEHEKTVAGIVNSYLEKKQNQQKDVVLDFLFGYYAFRPSRLKKWSPGFGVMLKEAAPDNFPSSAGRQMAFTDEGAFLNLKYFPAHRKHSAKWILSLLKNSLRKKPSFGCFGMHEWAMVYKTEQMRHRHLRLRMPEEELADFIKSRPLVCTHFDAFRHFTGPAKSLNKFAPSQEEVVDTEQPGCLHTNMDLYKWAFKMYPWIGSELIRKAFILAIEARKVDMKASPYDLREQGLAPIKIETKQGRMKYVKLQKEIYGRSISIREQLIQKYQQLLAIL